MASAYWQARNARAIALGYANYYDYRAHDNGRLPPSAPRLQGEMLAVSRGHRGVADFRRAVRSGRVSMAQVYDVERDARGRRRSVSMLVTDVRGRQRLYKLKTAPLTDDELAAIDAELEAQQVDVREYTRKTQVADLVEEPELDLDDLEEEEPEDGDEFPF